MYAATSERFCVSNKALSGVHAAGPQAPLWISVGNALLILQKKLALRCSAVCSSGAAVPAGVVEEDPRSQLCKAPCFRMPTWIMICIHKEFGSLNATS